MLGSLSALLLQHGLFTLTDSKFHFASPGLKKPRLKLHGCPMVVCSSSQLISSVSLVDTADPPMPVLSPKQASIASSYDFAEVSSAFCMSGLCSTPSSQYVIDLQGTLSPFFSWPTAQSSIQEQLLCA